MATHHSPVYHLWGSICIMSFQNTSFLYPLITLSNAQIKNSCYHESEMRIRWGGGGGQVFQAQFILRLGGRQHSSI